MTKRARQFVDHWIGEFLQPDMYEDEESLSESRVNAAACVRAASQYGIARAEIDEEFADLVAHFAWMHERIVDAGLSSLGPSGPRAQAA